MAMFKVTRVFRDDGHWHEARTETHLVSARDENHARELIGELRVSSLTTLCETKVEEIDETFGIKFPFREV